MAATADVACAGLAWGGGRGGTAPGSRALGRGRPGAGLGNKPGAMGLPPPGGFLDSPGTRKGCSRLTLLPTRLGPPQPGTLSAWVWASQRAPCL